MVYCNLLKSMDSTNREKDIRYEATSSLLGWASSLHRPLCAVSKNFFELPVVCSHILSVQVSVPPHCKGTSGCLSV
jgi:hypothetical protein